MKKVKNTTLLLAIFGCFFIGTAGLSAAECALCESIRAENAAHPNKYEYYEDYLKAKENGEPTKKTPEEKAPKADS